MNELAKYLIYYCYHLVEICLGYKIKVEYLIISSLLFLKLSLKEEELDSMIS